MSDTETIYTRHPDSAPWEIDARINPYIQEQGCTTSTSSLGRVDRALVERWRQKTHTFHLPLGEATITLLDVVVLTRLSIEGHVVCTIGSQLDSWRDIVHRVLRV